MIITLLLVERVLRTKRGSRCAELVVLAELVLAESVLAESVLPELVR
jgi:hypothetical protein